MISIPLIVWIVGLLTLIIFSRPKVSDPALVNAGVIAFAIGLFLWCLSVSGVKVF
jgi:hypothetical protein